jgi:hypothetical protein
MILAVVLPAFSSAAAWTQYGAPFGSGVYVQQGGQRGKSSGRPSRDRQEAQRQQGDRERGNSMTPDERRELNRDLQRANREIYRKGREGR